MSVKWRQLGRQEAGVPEAPGDTPWWIVGIFVLAVAFVCLPQYMARRAA